MKLLKPKGWISQLFGLNDVDYKLYGLKGHPGIDFVQGFNSPIQACADGLVYKTVNKDCKDLSGQRSVHQLVEDGGLVWELSYLHVLNIYCEKGDYLVEGQSFSTEGNCFDNKTEILTNEGWKLFNDLSKKELILTLNPETLKMEYKKPNSYTKKIFDKMYSYRNRTSLDFVVSDNHNMVIENNGLKIIQLKDLPKRSSIRQIGGIWVGKEEKYITIPKRTYKSNGWGTIKTTEPIKVKMDDWLEFLGWWLSDGWLNNGKQKFFGITQSFNNEEKRIKIKKLIKRLPFHFTEKKEDFTCASQQIFDYLKKFGTKDNKTIPEFIFNLSPRQIRIFLDSYWLGDGWNHKGTKYYIFGEKKLADQVQELLLKCGVCGIIKERNPLLIHRKNKAMIGNQEVISKKPYWVITEPKLKLASLEKNNIKEIKYNDYAYCLNVDNHIIYVRRNGRPMWCGNTGACWTVKSGVTVPVSAEERILGVGSHLHFSAKPCKRVSKITKDDSMYLYTEFGDKYFDGHYYEIVYDNGLNGNIDPMPYFYTPTISQLLSILYKVGLNLLKSL
jgi:intein/homing endonuclease